MATLDASVMTPSLAVHEALDAADLSNALDEIVKALLDQTTVK